MRNDQWVLRLERAIGEVDTEEIQIETKSMNLDEQGWPGLLKRTGLQLSRITDNSCGRFDFLQKAKSRLNLISFERANKMSWHKAIAIV